MASASAHDLNQLVTERSIVICCGSGGAGKTTTSAAIALAGARAGRRACVVTIDPARRLADALGVGGALSNNAHRIEGEWPGELFALMLDAKSTFDELVVRYSGDPEQTQRILSNGLYRNLTSALSGTQEYMAAEKLYELHESGEYDIVVVDTPPTRNALDFLDAPRRLTRFLENRVFRLLLMPGRASMKALSVATQALLRTISKVAGSEIVEDAVAFFRAFEGMEQGFRDRAHRVEQLLADPGTAFVLVAAPRRDSVEEARYFSARLAQSGVPVAALVMNRVHPDFRAGGPAGSTGAREAGGKAGRGTTDDATRGAGGDAEQAGVDEGAQAGVVKAEQAGGGDGSPTLEPDEAYALLAGLRRNLDDLETVASAEHAYVTELEAGVEGAVVTVPYLRGDVHDLDGLSLVADLVTGSPGRVASERA